MNEKTVCRDYFLLCNQERNILITSGTFNKKFAKAILRFATAG